MSWNSPQLNGDHWLPKLRSTPSIGLHQIESIVGVTITTFIVLIITISIFITQNPAVIIDYVRPETKWISGAHMLWSAQAGQLPGGKTNPWKYGDDYVEGEIFAWQRSSQTHVWFASFQWGIQIPDRNVVIPPSRPSLTNLREPQQLLHSTKSHHSARNVFHNIKNSPVAANWRGHQNCGEERQTQSGRHWHGLRLLQLRSHL